MGSILLRLGNWAEWTVAPMLALTTYFAFDHEQYVTAVVVAMCAGLVLGVKLATALFERRLEREVQRELDALFEAYR